METNTKLPWVRFYIGDFVEDTQHLTLAQVGAYIRLLKRQWFMGSVPDDLPQLARIIGASTTEFEREIWPDLAEFFVSDGHGGLINERLERERTAQDRRRVERSKAGKRGARKRWSKNNVNNGIDGGTIAEPLAELKQTLWQTDSESEIDLESKSESKAKLERERRSEKDQNLKFSARAREAELRNAEIESNGFVALSDVPSIGAFLQGVNTAVAEREALDYDDITYTLNAFFPPERPGAGTNPAVKAWLGRIPEQTIGSALRYLRAQTYTVEGEERTWGQLTDEHCKRVIMAGLNAILRERSNR